MKKYFVYNKFSKELYCIHINEKEEAEKMCDELNRWLNKYKVGTAIYDRGLTVELIPNHREFWENGETKK